MGAFSQASVTTEYLGQQTLGGRPRGFLVVEDEDGIPEFEPLGKRWLLRQEGMGGGK